MRITSTRPALWRERQERVLWVPCPSSLNIDFRHFRICYMEIDANCARLTCTCLAIGNQRGYLRSVYMKVKSNSAHTQRELLQQHQNAISAPARRAACERFCSLVQGVCGTVCFHVSRSITLCLSTKRSPCFSCYVCARVYCSLLVCVLLFYINI